MPAYSNDDQAHNYNIVELKLGMNSEGLPNGTAWGGLVVYDRDPFGYVTAQRNSTGRSAWTLRNLYGSCDVSDAGNLGVATPNYSANVMDSCNPQGLLYAYRMDGFFDGTQTFHGVRTYASDTNQWSSPDAWGGNPANPISGLSYNYADNNPALFDDASGF